MTRVFYFMFLTTLGRKVVTATNFRNLILEKVVWSNIVVSDYDYIILVWELYTCSYNVITCT